MRHLLGVTGTPGTGKRTVATELAGLIGFASQDLNVLARELGCVERRGDSAVVVDTVRLGRLLRERAWSKVVFHGHLLPDLFRGKELDYVAVLRCDPAVLKQRLQARGYTGDHLRENLEAELIGVSLSSSLRSFGAARVAEFITSKAEPREVASAIFDGYEADRGSRSSRKKRWIDWTTHYESAAELTSLLLSSSRTNSAFTWTRIGF